MSILIGDSLKPASILLIDIVQWILDSALQAHQLICNLTETPDINLMVMRLSVQYFRSKKTEAFILYLLGDCAKLLFRNYGKVKVAEIRELIALTTL